ncbi:MAG TPA: hypothetical protein VH230_09055 [Stellaceae bacterium]|jgi:hypothetical protein|nr:hypothetical protein [Stellaceae bacterium]
MSAPDPHGQVSLMLCESLLHLLVERQIITRADAIDAIDGVAELAHEMTERGTFRNGRSSPVALIDRIRQSFEAKD